MKLSLLLCALVCLPAAAMADKGVVSGTRPLSREAVVVEICRKFVQAQIRHTQQDRDDDSIREYAQAFVRTKHQPDALYDPAAPGAGVDPLWQRLEQAHRRGYFARRGGVQAPYSGYWFAILKAQGESARGGYRDYLVGSHLTGGFALIAWPAAYGESGRNTFMVNQTGRILRKDFGPDTPAIAKEIITYDPDASWTPVAQ